MTTPDPLAYLDALGPINELHFDRNGYCNCCGGAFPCLTQKLARDLLVRGVAEGRRQATDGYEPLRAAVGGVKRLNRPMIEQLRRAAADTSPNWDVTATVYPPSARDLVALIDALLAVDPWEPTGGWERRWSVRDQHGRVSKSGFTEAGAKARAAETGGTFVTRLVGPWEDVEQGGDAA